ncbi:hypothetical protein Golob_022839 [Gossypium lobatum]|uniref:Uncharacterized protein n=1 Tax=Gossypium lobatum TaxID=34289 RepID=A0A7J8LHS4_9ROSI|nr:hypothetical protein [Gossypium lobatum]
MSAINSFEQNIVPGIRHVCLVNSNDSSDENVSKFFNKIGYLCTLVFPISSKSFIETCVKRFQHLRMLNLSETTSRLWILMVVTKLKSCTRIWDTWSI